jgi:hypothetical protein
MIDHIVLLKFSAAATASDILDLERAVQALGKQIEGVEGVRWGISSSPEGLERGYTHGFIMRLRDDAARTAYLPHPRHRVVADTIGRLCDDILVFDIS